MTHYEKKHLQQQQQPLSIYSLSQKIVPKYFIERSWAQFRLPLSNICTFVDNFSSPTTTTTTSGKKENKIFNINIHFNINKTYIIHIYL